MELPIGKQGLEFWRGHVVAAEGFVGSLAEYCRQNSLSQSQFVYYRKKFSKKSKFSEVKVAEKKASEVLAKGIQSYPQRLPDPKWLSMLIRELSQ